MFLLNVDSILTMVLSVISIVRIYQPGGSVGRIALVVLGFLDFALSFYITVMNQKYAKQNGKQEDLLWKVNAAASLLVVLASYFALTGVARHVFAVGLGFAVLSNLGDLGLKILNAAGGKH